MRELNSSCPFLTLRGQSLPELKPFRGVKDIKARPVLKAFQSVYLAVWIVPNDVVVCCYAATGAPYDILS